jgi:hypothetical protein
MNDDGTAAPALIAMKSTQLKKGRKWNSMIQGRTMMGKNGPFQMPRFSNVYLLQAAWRRKTPKAHGTGGTSASKAPSPTAHSTGKPAAFAESINRGDVQREALA